MRISDWISDVCSSDLPRCRAALRRGHEREAAVQLAGKGFGKPDAHALAETGVEIGGQSLSIVRDVERYRTVADVQADMDAAAPMRQAMFDGIVDRFGHDQRHRHGDVGFQGQAVGRIDGQDDVVAAAGRSEEHTSELQSLMRSSYA